MKKNAQQPIAKSETKSKILYIDTSEPEAVLAIYEGHRIIKKEIWQAHRELSATLSEKYSNILKNIGISQRDLAGIAVYRGPGSFTGLRIGISFANALAYGLDIPIYGIEKKDLLDLSKPDRVIVPIYGAEPNITKPRSK